MRAQSNCFLRETTNKRLGLKATVKRNPLLTCPRSHNHIHSVMTASCVGAAAAGCLGGRCDRRYLRGCQQQIQADGLWLCQVSALSRGGGGNLAMCFAPAVCVSSVRTCQFCVCQDLPSVCLCNPPRWQEFLFLSAHLHVIVCLFVCVCSSPTSLSLIHF